MRNELPENYSRLRWTFAVGYLVVLGALVAGVVIWASTDNHGGRAIAALVGGQESVGPVIVDRPQAKVPKRMRVGEKRQLPKTTTSDLKVEWIPKRGPSCQIKGRTVTALAKGVCHVRGTLTVAPESRVDERIAITRKRSG